MDLWHPWYRIINALLDSVSNMGVRQMASRLLLAASAAAFLTIAGCQTTGGGSPAPVSPIIGQIQEQAAKICGFLPDEGVVTKLIGFFSPDAAGIYAMARQICNVVVVQSLEGRRASTPRLHGVRITGVWVRK
jgi:hypothetical protein